MSAAVSPRARNSSVRRDLVTTAATHVPVAVIVATGQLVDADAGR